MPRTADKHRIPLDAPKVRELREAQKLSQAALAKRAGLPSAQYLSDIERGIRVNLTIETLDRIAAALGVKAKDLLK
ncbi:MAG TPA: helix-turn-helix transcriptional regulator [Tepidisphaeraceae bacterium]|nr:helix-turn-helix transcriptional regulator [Tepidisphaeraceae bacterium]